MVTKKNIYKKELNMKKTDIIFVSIIDSWIFPDYCALFYTIQRFLC